MGGRGDPFRNPGGGGRSGAIYQGIKASMGYNNLNASHSVVQITGDRDDYKPRRDAQSKVGSKLC